MDKDGLGFALFLYVIGLLAMVPLTIDSYKRYKEIEPFSVIYFGIGVILVTYMFFS